MFSTPKPDDVEGWECIYKTNTDYDAQLAKSYLESREIECRVLSKRDSAFELSVGEMSLIYIYAPKDMAAKAKKAIDEWQEGLSELSDGDEE